MQYSVIIPTLNAGRILAALLENLSTQTVHPAEIVVIDSQSDDETIQLAREYESVRTIEIKRSEFDHGGTRDMAIRTCRTPIVVMMTQDAFPENKQCMENLLTTFDYSDIAAVCARQVANNNATAAEKAVREFRYPNQSSIWGKTDIEQRGISAYLLSDVCTAYRVAAYKAVGGFKHPIITNEDMLIAADFLDEGYRLAYQANAVVRHSHHYSLKQEYQRNRFIGQFLAQYGQRFDTGGEIGEGLRLVKYVTGELITDGKFSEIIPFWSNCAARFLGNRVGKKTALRE